MKNKNERLVFVYGTLQRGGRLNQSLVTAGGEYLCDARIESKEFVMRDCKAYPALQKVEPGSGHVIHGELFCVPTEGIAVLDRTEGYPDLYNRETVSVSAVGGGTCDNVLVYFMDNNLQWLSTMMVCESGKWNPYTNTAEYSGYDYSDSIDEAGYGMGDDCPACGYWLLDGKCNECAAANACTDFSGIAETKAETTDVNATDFTVDNGIYIVGQFGEFFGPYESIEEACGKIGHVATALGVDTKVLTIGFRVVRNDVTPTAYSDIDAFTEKV